MLSITSSQPAVWSPPPGPAVTAVSPTAQVQPVQATARDAQTGGSSGRETSGAAQPVRVGGPRRERETERTEKGALPDAAPLLPRESPDAPDQPDSPEKAQAKAEAEREQQARQAEDKAFKQKLQDVISNVWKASAAVVDVALSARSASVADEAAALSAAEAVSGTEPVAPAALASAVPGVPVQEAANDAVAELAELRAGQEVVAYDAAGHSSLAPLEAGTLISRRV